MNEIKNSIDNQDEFYRIKNNDLKKKGLVTGLRVISLIIIGTALFMTINKSIGFIKKERLFNINNLIIEGNHYLKFNDILSIINLQTGDNLFNINLIDVKKKLELHPRVKAALIRRELPDKIIITIEERKSLALINCRKEFMNSLFEIDEQGYVTGEYPSIDDYDLPVITGFESENVFLGTKLTNHSLLNVLNALAGMEKKYYNFNRMVAEVNMNRSFNNSNIILYLNPYNTKVIFGGNFNENKLNKLNSLLMVVGDKISKLEYIDFKYDEAISKYKG